LLLEKSSGDWLLDREDESNPESSCDADRVATLASRRKKSSPIKKRVCESEAEGARRLISISIAGEGLVLFTRPSRMTLSWLFLFFFLSSAFEVLAAPREEVETFVSKVFVDALPVAQRSVTPRLSLMERYRRVMEPVTRERRRLASVMDKVVEAFETCRSPECRMWYQSLAFSTSVAMADQFRQVIPIISGNFSRACDTQEMSVKGKCRIFFASEVATMRSSEASERAVSVIRLPLNYGVPGAVMSGLGFVCASLIVALAAYGWKGHLDWKLVVIPSTIATGSCLRLSFWVISMIGTGAAPATPMFVVLVISRLSYILTSATLALFLYLWMGAYFKSFSPNSIALKIYSIAVSVVVGILLCYSVAVTVALMYVNTSDLSWILHSTLQFSLCLGLVIFAGLSLSKLRQTTDHKLHHSAMRNAVIMLGLLAAMCLAFCGRLAVYYLYQLAPSSMFPDHFVWWYYAFGFLIPEPMYWSVVLIVATLNCWPRQGIAKVSQPGYVPLAENDQNVPTPARYANF
jgi:hypothetical protein